MQPQRWHRSIAPNLTVNGKYQSCEPSASIEASLQTYKLHEASTKSPRCKDWAVAPDLQITKLQTHIIHAGIAQPCYTSAQPLKHFSTPVNYKELPSVKKTAQALNHCSSTGIEPLQANINQATPAQALKHCIRHVNHKQISSNINHAIPVRAWMMSQDF